MSKHKHIIIETRATGDEALYWAEVVDGPMSMLGERDCGKTRERAYLDLREHLRALNPESSLEFIHAPM